MECDFCGWNNPEGTLICERCGIVLGKSVPNENDSAVGSDGGQGEDDAMGNESCCAHCGYPLIPNTKRCPNCHEPVVVKRKNGGEEGEEKKKTEENKPYENENHRDDSKATKRNISTIAQEGGSADDSSEEKETVVAGVVVNDPKKTMIAEVVVVNDSKKTKRVDVVVDNPKQTVKDDAVVNDMKKTKRVDVVVDNPKQTVKDDAVVNDMKKTMRVDTVVDNPKKTEESNPVQDPKKTARVDIGSLNAKETLDDIANAKKTVNPYAKAKLEQQEEEKQVLCSLMPIADNSAEEGRLKENEYSSETIVLRRDNTEAGNYSITSKEQAYLTFEDGNWYIEDKSSFQSTFVRACRKMQLQDGDVIMLGDRRFEFKTKK